jgi:hypothetical protein
MTQLLSSAVTTLCTDRPVNRTSFCWWRDARARCYNAPERRVA